MTKTIEQTHVYLSCPECGMKCFPSASGLWVAGTKASCGFCESSLMVGISANGHAESQVLQAGDPNVVREKIDFASHSAAQHRIGPMSRNQR